MKYFLILILLVFAFQSCQVKPKSSVSSKAETSKQEYDSIRVKLETMYHKDQEIRRIIFDSLGFGSPQIKEYLTKMLETDSLNQVQLKKILAKHGWIPKSKIGETASDAIFFIVQHSDVKLMEQYFPQLKELALKGEAKKIHSAMMEDRLLMWQGKKQKYGTQASSTLRDDNRMAIWPIENPDSVNFYRKMIGFELTVEENAKKMDAEYDKNERLPEASKK